MQTTQFETVRHEKDGEVWEGSRCKLCGAVSLAGEQEVHKCPPSVTEQDEAIEEEAYVTALGAVSAAEGLKAQVEAIHSLENVTYFIGNNRVRRVSKKYTPQILRGMVSQEITWQIDRTRRMRDAEFLRNDELRSKGTPFVERMKLINQKKLDWCDQEEIRLTQLIKTFRVRPVEEWFGLVEYESAKRMGMAWVIKISLYKIIA